MTTKPQPTTETLEPCPWCKAVPEQTDLAPSQRYRITHEPTCFLIGRLADPRGREGRAHYIPLREVSVWNSARANPASTAPVVDEDSEPDIYDLVAQYRDRMMTEPVCVHCELPIALEQSGWIHVGSGLVTCRRTGLAKHDGVFRAEPAASTAAPQQSDENGL